MKFYLSNAFFFNRAPFEKLEMHFEENEIAVLTAVNGRGKTTVLSHIVDAFHEMARPFFQNEYEGRENQFYRVSSQMDNLDAQKPSLVYLRFKFSNGRFVDFVNARGSLTEAEYNSFGLPADKINFNEFKESLANSYFAKKISSNFNKKIADEVFGENLMTFFPAYRYEAPGYLNDSYQIELNFTKKSGFSGNLNNPIEVVSGLPQLANWIMDVVLDMVVTKDAKSIALFKNLSEILTSALISKKYGPLRFGIGPRGFGGARIQVMTANGEIKSIYPSIFNISSGESSMLCLFAEVLRQADKNMTGISLDTISGIVLIDEVDKHLHIKLQKEILPALFMLFPNVQFIVSSHSPFLTMGLAEVTAGRTKIIDLETFGISKDPTINDLYAEVYSMMIGENDRFKEMYSSLERMVKNGKVPLVVTEGKTDVQHLRAAKSRLNIQDCEIEFFDINGDWGDSKLKLLLEQLSKVPQKRKVIGIFDRDVAKIVDEIEKDGNLYKAFGNNVFAFCLPVPKGREEYTNISIEFFYNDNDLKSEKDGRRIYFDNEVVIQQLPANRAEKEVVKLNTPNQKYENSKKIFDENIGLTEGIHSKAVFSNLVENDLDFSKNFDFGNFQLIFTRLREIIATKDDV